LILIAYIWAETITPEAVAGIEAVAEAGEALACPAGEILGPTIR
jgi:hypothetical protein